MWNNCTVSEQYGHIWPSYAANVPFHHSTFKCSKIRSKIFYLLSLCFVFVVLFVLFVGFFLLSFSQLFSSLLSFHFKQRSRKLSDARENEHHRGYDRKWREFSGPITARRKVNALLETVLQLIKIFSLFLDRNHKTGGSLEWSSVSTKSWHFSKFPSHFFFSLVFFYFQFTTALAITEGSVD